VVPTLLTTPDLAEEDFPADGLASGEVLERS
jgi:hypothetical protein